MWPRKYAEIQENLKLHAVVILGGDGGCSDMAINWNHRLYWFENHFAMPFAAAYVSNGPVNNNKTFYLVYVRLKRVKYEIAHSLSQWIYYGRMFHEKVSNGKKCLMTAGSCFLHPTYSHSANYVFFFSSLICYNPIAHVLLCTCLFHCSESWREGLKTHRNWKNKKKFSLPRKNT